MTRGPWRCGPALPDGWIVEEWSTTGWITFGHFPCADDAEEVCLTLNRTHWGEPYPHLPEPGRAA